MANLRYYLGPWVWHSDRYWSPPAGTVGLVDLRNLADQALAGQFGDRPYGFFAVNQALGSEYDLLGQGDLREIAVVSAQQDAWESLLGYRPQGATLVDLLFDQLTAGSDPAGGSVPPLMPTTKGVLSLYLGGHSLVKSERYQHGRHPHMGKVQDVLRRNFRRIHAANQEHSRRVLDYWLDKYRCDKGDWQRFVPEDLRGEIPGPLPHQTTITDDFNRADQSGLGSSSEGWSWTATIGGYNIVSNEAENVAMTGNLAFARAESDLSSEDHYAQVDVTTVAQNRQGVAARFSDSADTAYMFVERQVVPDFAIFKRVTGTDTLLNDSASGATEPFTIKGECDGSGLTLYVDDVSEVTITDTDITGNVRAGLHHGGTSVGGTVDNFEAADLAAVASAVSASKTSVSVGLEL